MVGVPHIGSSEYDNIFDAYNYLESFRIVHCKRYRFRALKDWIATLDSL
jgi:hypothetical protein